MSMTTITPLRSVAAVPRMTDPTLAGYVREAKLSDDILGNLVLYTVEGVDAVRHADLASLLTLHGLDQFIPRAPSDIDVFRRAVTSVQAKRVELSGTDVYVNILARDVSNDPDELVRRLVLETVDGAGRRLDYSPFYDWVLDKRTKRADLIRLTPTMIDPALQAIADRVSMEALNRYAALVGTVDGAAIRSLLNKVITENHGAALRTGAYFTLADRSHVVASLEALAGFVDGVTVHSIPIIDTAKQRRFIAEAVESEARAESEALTRTVDEFSAILKSGADVSGEAFATLAGRYRKLREKAEAYAATLETDLTQTTTALEVLAMQMAQLSGAMKGAA